MAADSVPRFLPLQVLYWLAVLEYAFFSQEDTYRSTHGLTLNQNRSLCNVPPKFKVVGPPNAMIQA